MEEITLNELILGGHQITMSPCLGMGGEGHVRIELWDTKWGDHVYTLISKAALSASKTEKDRLIYSSLAKMGKMLSSRKMGCDDFRRP